jgi:spoIIIJ-associated protein
MTEFTGRTVEEAIETGLTALNFNREEVEIEVLEEGRTGVFGMGSRLATVRITLADAESTSQTSAVEDVIETTDSPAGETEPGSAPISEAVVEMQTLDEDEEIVENAVDSSADDFPIEAEEELAEEDEVIAISQDFLQNMLDLMGLKTQVVSKVIEPDSDNREPTYYLNIEGEDLGSLIGRRGETLGSIQYLVRLVVNRHMHNWPRIEVDVEHYKERRERSLERIANTMADKAVRENRTVFMEAMPARERRLVHIALRNRDDVYTESIGEGENRKVGIYLT